MSLIINNKHPKFTTWLATAVGIAVVSGLFSLIVAGFLLSNHLARQSNLQTKEPVYSKEILQKKALLNQNPQNEALKEEIRNLDLELRENFFTRKVFSRQGAYLLLIGIAVFVLAMKTIYNLCQSPPVPTTSDIPPDHEANQLKQSRIALGGLGTFLAFGIILLALQPNVEFSTLSSHAETPEAVKDEPPTQEEIQQNWPRFRGPGGLGIVQHENIPVTWDSETGESILWKTRIPIPGNNSPIVWGNRVFISGASETEKAVLCYSTESGDLLWRGDLNDIPVREKEKIRLFEGTGYASSTMACDGSRVYAIFADGVLAGFDLKGQRLWAKSMGIPDSVYGYATSLLCYQHNLLVQYDQGTMDDDQSILYSLEGKTGDVVWQKQRPVANTWTTPIIINTGDTEQLITCSEPWVIAYDPASGDELWRADLMGHDLAPSPVFANGLVFVTQPHETLFAIRPNERGDVTESAVVMELDCPAPDICSPVSNGELLFLLDTMGYLGCYDTKTGEMYWENQLEGTFNASPSLVGEWLYVINEEGVTYRVKAAKEYEVAETQSFLHEKVVASPAFIENRIFIRGESNLFCIGTP